MASSSSNQFSNGNLNTPKQQRRMTSPAESSLSLPAGSLKTTARPPSPLRHGYVMDTGTGIDPSHDFEGSDEDDDEEPANWQRSPSPSSSVSNLAASFVQRMNNFVGGIAPKSPGTMPSDAELEAEAELERDRSRREAEAILTREAQQRKIVEERVLAMMQSVKGLPPPPSRSQTMPNTPSPPPHQKEPSWWSAAKHRLTPTKDKEPLTPAQQIIHEAKAREKEKKNGKGKEKEETKPSDNDLGKLNIPVPPPTRKPVPSSPSSPTPSRPSLSNMPPNLTPSPMRTTDSLSSSPSREAPPLYAQFNTQGTLDVASTLITIAKRFEKLEKWTVGHVRALEERMNDVERWLVDKEKEKAETASVKEEPAKSISTEVHQDLREIRGEITELQGRVGELGREMAKMATAPSNPAPGPKAQTASFNAAPLPPSSALVQNHTGTSIPSTPHHPRLSSSSAVESTSPPLNPTKTPSGTRLPYPQGDYTSPPDTFSPPNSPPIPLDNSARSSRISGLPPSSTPYLSSYPSTSSLSSVRARAVSPPGRLANAARATSPSPSGGGLPPPKTVNPRQTSISPTPRKRYTVALGGLAAPELSSNAADPPNSKRVATPKTFHKALASDDEDDDNDDGDDTIGKSASARLTSSAAFAGGMGAGDYKPFTSATVPSSTMGRSSSPSPMSNRRIRAQSAYGFSSIAGASTAGTTAPLSVAPLKPKLRSKSSERVNSSMSGSSSGTGDGMISSLGGGNKFVDPLILRKQSRDNMKPIAMPRPVGKVPIGQLVAFFDRDKKP